MNAVVKTRIVKIGNSQGIRIPKWLLEQSGLSGPVEIEAQSGQLVLRAGETPARQGWAEAFQRMAAAGDDAPLDEPSFPTSEWDEAQWQW